VQTRNMTGCCCQPSAFAWLLPWGFSLWCRRG